MVGKKKKALLKLASWLQLLLLLLPGCHGCIPGLGELGELGKLGDVAAEAAEREIPAAVEGPSMVVGESNWY